MDADFLLDTPAASKLFHEYAESMPIFDYHCHINPSEILENKCYNNLTELWLGGDHYKWRAMRSNGVSEELCTGNADPYDKFLAFCETLSRAPGNPLYHWSHLELQRYFGITDILTPANARKIWDASAAQLGENGMHCRDFIEKSNVKVICTTDDPADDLAVHAKLRNEKLSFRVLPAYRPDKALEITKPDYTDYIARLSSVCGYAIDSFEALKKAMAQRLAFFHENGCRLSDTGLMRMPWAPASDADVDAIFKKRLAGDAISDAEDAAFKTALMLHLGRLYAENDWCMQLHLGPMRNNNSRKFASIGADTGFDSVSDEIMAVALSRFMDALDMDGRLPRTILYTLNPKDYPVLVSMLGNFQSSPAGKIQFGSAWWFNDHKEGMEDQIKALAAGGILGTFVGMLTDSRSFTSYPRHEYFRRILCNVLGNWVENGEYPADWENLGSIVQDISYNNANKYFHM